MENHFTNSDFSELFRDRADLAVISLNFIRSRKKTSPPKPL